MDILENPFCLLDVSTRDARARILEQSDEKSLTLDPQVCSKACTDLVTPKNRFLAEIGWVVGVAPKRAAELVDLLRNAPEALRGQNSIPSLARMNLLAAAISRVSEPLNSSDVREWVLLLADVFEEISTADVVRDVNEDRRIARFPEIRPEDVEAGLNERRKYYKSVVRDFLDRLPTADLMEVVGEIAGEAALDGRTQAPVLIEDIVDQYEIEVHGYLEQESEGIRSLCNKVLTLAGEREEPYVTSVLKGLAKPLRRWTKVALPIQVIGKARGLPHDGTQGLAYSVRSMGIDLANKHDYYESARYCTELLQDTFGEQSDIGDRLAEDMSTVTGLLDQRENAAEEHEKWVKAITFDFKLGVLFRKSFSMSPDGITYDGHTLALADITRVRWGGLRSENGIQHTVAYGTDEKLTSVQTPSSKVFERVTSAIWRGVGLRIIGEMLRDLKEGGQRTFGDVVVKDDAVVLSNWGSKYEGKRLRVPWAYVACETKNGDLCLSVKGDNDIGDSLSYLEIDNAHLLETAVRMLLAKIENDVQGQGVKGESAPAYRLSDTLGG